MPSPAGTKMASVPAGVDPKHAPVEELSNGDGHAALSRKPVPQTQSSQAEEEEEYIASQLEPNARDLDGYVPTSPGQPPSEISSLEVSRNEGEGDEDGRAWNGIVTQRSFNSSLGSV